jgi:CRP-like cAMP-binding protein
LVNIGCRSADERTAHFLLELGVRLTAIGMEKSAGYTCPLTQYHLADGPGLSAVHLNCVLRRLRELGLLTFRDGQVVFDDYAGLVKLAGFDAS